MLIFSISYQNSYLIFPLQIFTSTFPFDLVARVWDSFLIEGWKVVYRTMLSLLKSAQLDGDLLNQDFEQILTYLRQFQSKVDAENIMASSFKMKLRQTHIQKYASEFERGEISVEKDMNQNADSVDGLSAVHRFVFKLKPSTREMGVKNLSPKLVPIVGSSKFVVVLSNVLSPEECRGLIKRAKGVRFQEILIRGEGGKEVDNIASCQRSKVEDQCLSSEVFSRVQGALRGSQLEPKFLHASWMSSVNTNELTATGLNERIHFVRYGIGDFFAPRQDVCCRFRNEISHVTMQLFLNQNFKGGVVSFRGMGNRFFDIKPNVGSVLLFDQDLRVEECEVTAGTKYVMRSDVMYAAS